MNNIFLYGPFFNLKNAKYGGGTGGYTRNMRVYLEEFKFNDLKVIPVFHSVDGQFKFGKLTLLIRLSYDIVKIILSLIRIRPVVVHCLAQYRRALPRELILVFLSRLFGIPVLYEIKAGAFITTYNESSGLYRKGISYIIKKSQTILCEGKPYVEFINHKFGKESYYFPNVIKDSEIIGAPYQKLKNDYISVLFVGYCFKDKGVFELVKACELAYERGVKLNLSLIGEEHSEFKSYMDNQSDRFKFEIRRLGKQPHDRVLQEFDRHDIYCYPTYHKGEGHNNTINEAMMKGMIIVTTKTGFLNDILDESRAYQLELVSEEGLSKIFNEIFHNRELANEKATNAFLFLKENFLSSTASIKIYEHYKKLI